MIIKDYNNLVIEIKTLTDYENVAKTTATYPNVGNNIIYPVLGLCGESGEVAEKIKKVMRDNNGMISEELKELLILELGDVLWYITAVALELGSTLGIVAAKNIIKLTNRQKEGKLKGNGDKR